MKHELIGNKRYYYPIDETQASEDKKYSDSDVSSDEMEGSQGLQMQESSSLARITEEDQELEEKLQAKFAYKQFSNAKLKMHYFYNFFTDKTNDEILHRASQLGDLEFNFMVP